MEIQVNSAVRLEIGRVQTYLLFHDSSMGVTLPTLLL
jgi:hypothetical protein